MSEVWGAPTPVRRTRSSEVVFDFEGRQISAHEGDSIAAALIAQGVHIFGRSWKYHRPRGYRCGQGHCSACSMRVDGLPGVRTCVTPVRSGMRVEREHALPTADHDLLRAIDLLSPFMPPGFYYRRFRHSPRLWGLMERTVARVSGQGDMPSPQAAARFAGGRCERRDGPEVLVVGGGVAGLSAALAAAEAGAQIMLVEQDDRLGGRALDIAPRQPDPRLVDTLVERVIGDDRVEVLTGSPAVGWYDEGVVAIDREPDLLLLTPAAVVLATGAYDRALPFANWDLPGVMFATAARRLLRRYGVSPGSRAVVLTTGAHGYGVAHDLESSGIEVACVADTRSCAAGGPELLGQRRALPLLHLASSARAHGRTRVAAVSVDVRDGAQSHRYECDLIVVSAGLRPADDLAYQVLARGSLVLSATGVSAVCERLWLAGLAAGTCTSESALEQGTKAGRCAARSVQKG